jgi:hypothetical protein
MYRRYEITSVADPDPGYGAFLTPGSRNPDVYEHPRSFSESLGTVITIYVYKYFDADPNPGLKFRTRDQHPGPATLEITYNIIH